MYEGLPSLEKCLSAGTLGEKQVKTVALKGVTGMGCY